MPNRAAQGEINNLSVREIKPEDIPYVADYWFNASTEYLNSMGVEPAKLPSREMFEAKLLEQINMPYSQKQAYALIWEADGKAIGHCNVNPVVYNDSAYMHLHLWDNTKRYKGIGTTLVKMSVPYLFTNLKLKTLYCEPYVLNHAPNKVLEKSGFIFVREYVTTPGSITFEQPVKRWELSAK